MSFGESIDLPPEASFYYATSINATVNATVNATINATVNATINVLTEASVA